MAKLYPYLTFNNSKEALDYYGRVFGATNIQRVTPQVEQAAAFKLTASELDKATIHASFSILGTELFCSDCFGYEMTSGNQISIMLDINSEDPEAVIEAEAFYQRLVESKTVTVSMPYEPQFWGGKMGAFTDQYGIPWMLHSQPYSKQQK
ncbi:glyoxalase/bleomycin resistance/extradiol dioxygenase family protein [Vagococcus sp. BWB3-3]|uniref:Glyoxalase/bleomycin resistance/extradiol dioxygenase family protein n=1 Tax=Vagococcus allomyrinae TaxID=2794353 RepID=A0A940SUR9_9ENTE|nr:glyoxalase/bleomycin resistance/extradiol dioxygenase family protein [Vagococcus allomyrinae]MBP1040331.1 glyoxalase/bleomycin resistance/extradiol dioxygenase family protein [Vagococcus allomyrinae]